MATTLDQTRPAAADTAPPLEPGALALVIADRGHVWVGRVTVNADFVEIAGARIIRRWGTTDGLNQLAAGGPTSSTKLDAPADVLVARRALIALVPCEASKWPA